MVVRVTADKIYQMALTEPALDDRVAALASLVSYHVAFRSNARRFSILQQLIRAEFEACNLFCPADPKQVVSQLFILALRNEGLGVKDMCGLLEIKALQKLIVRILNITPKYLDFAVQSGAVKTAQEAHQKCIKLLYKVLLPLQSLIETVHNEAPRLLLQSAPVFQLDPQSLTADATKLLAECTQLASRLVIFTRFLTNFYIHVFPIEFVPEVCQPAEFWLIWEKFTSPQMIDFRSPSFLNAMEVYISGVIKKLSEKLWGPGNVKCSNQKCKSPAMQAKDGVRLSCEHYLCKNCARSGAFSSCPIPTCKKPVTEDTLKNLQQRQALYAQQFAQFSMACGRFLLEVIANVCFATGERAVDASVVDKVLSILVPVATPATQASISATLFSEAPNLYSQLIRTLVRATPDKFLQPFLQRVTQTSARPAFIMRAIHSLEVTILPFSFSSMYHFIFYLALTPHFL